MTEEKRHEIIINSFKEELLFALSLNLTNELTDEIINQLEYEIIRISKELDIISQDEDISSLQKYLLIATDLVLKYNERKDNETLLKKAFYVTKAQLIFLDDFAEKENLGGKGKRSLALRTILNDFMNKEN